MTLEPTASGLWARRSSFWRLASAWNMRERSALLKLALGTTWAILPRVRAARKKKTRVEASSLGGTFL